MPLRILSRYRSKMHLHKSHDKNYARRLSGPLLDRIDLHVNVDPVAYADLSSNVKTSSSEVTKNRVIKARSIQLKRTGGIINALMHRNKLKLIAH
jgi:magnesium chelatase family protein